MNRISILLLTIAVMVLPACNSRPTDNKKPQTQADSLTVCETSDSDYDVLQDSLAFWTDDEIVREHGQLVNLAQHMWRMSRNDTIEGNMDFFMAEMERVNPLLVTYFDSHYSPGKLNEAQKIDSVLNEIEAVYVPMAGGPTMSSIVGLDVHIAVDRYRECVNYARMWQRVPDGPLRAALHDEMVKWKALEGDLSAYLSTISRLLFWGGSLSGPASLMASQSVVRSRLDDQTNVRAVLFAGKSRKSSRNLTQAESFFQRCLKQALDSVYYEDHDEMYNRQSDSLYVVEYNGVCNLRKDIKSSLAQWLKAREALGRVANKPDDAVEKVWPGITALFLTQLGKNATDAATF